MIVAVDGPAGVGKSTIAKRVAEQCGLFYLNSGNFYRAITYKHLQQGKDPYDTDSLVETGRTASLTIRDGTLHLDGIPVEDKLHNDEIDRHVARISSIIPIRTIVNDALRKVAEDTDVIIEGRDITTVVFPNAELKFYFDAAVEIRANRRYKQQNTSMNLKEIEDTIIKRDKIDTTKEFGALKVSDDAEYIDTSYLTIDEVCEKVVSKIKNFKQNKDQES